MAAQLQVLTNVLPGRPGVLTRGSILIISPWSRLWSLAPGAGVSDEIHMLTRFIRHGYEIHMLVPQSSDLMEPQPGLHVHTFPNVLRVPQWLPAPVKRLWLHPAFWGVAGRAAVRLARQIRPRLVMGFTPYGAWPAWRAGRAVAAPATLKLFGVMQAMRLEWSLPRYLYHSLEAVLAFRMPLDHFVILNDGTRGAEVARRWGVAPERISWLPNGIDTQWAALSPSREEIRHQHGVAADTVVFLSLSRLVESKRVDRILDAMQLATPQHAGRMLLWVAGDGPLRPRLQEQARRAGIDCTFLGTVRHDALPDVLAAADVLVATSELTNMSIPTCEAMVMGRPVVGLDVGGTAEVLRHEETGLLVPENDREALARALLRIAADTELRQRLGAAARNFAVANFWDWDRRVGAEIEIVDRLVAGSQGD